MHRIAFGNENRLLAIVNQHTVLAVATAHESTYRDGTTLLGFEFARRNLGESTVECHLLEDFHHVGTLCGSGGVDCRRHLLIVVRDIVLCVEKFKHRRLQRLLR